MVLKFAKYLILLNFGKGPFSPFFVKLTTSCGGGGLELDARLESEWCRLMSHSLGVSESDSRDVDVEGGDRCSPSASSSRYLCHINKCCHTSPFKTKLCYVFGMQ